ncbi:MAG: ribulose bisphosphate carboxylase small subunit [Chromatiaceae bacterium]|nr:ribulose bisphosphate carboxylase small subunit [Chromatiaceae bacterium]
MYDQIAYLIAQGWTPAIEHEHPSRSFNHYWTMWKLPIFGQQDMTASRPNWMPAIAPIRITIRLIGYDNYTQSQGVAFVVTRDAPEPWTKYDGRLALAANNTDGGSMTQRGNAQGLSGRQLALARRQAMSGAGKAADGCGIAGAAPQARGLTARRRRRLVSSSAAASSAWVPAAGLPHWPGARRCRPAARWRCRAGIACATPNRLRQRTR